MAIFEYIAKDSSGSDFSGTYTDVDNKAQLTEELSKMGYSLVKAHRRKSTAKRKKGKIDATEVVAFAYEFSGMYTAGLSIVRCLETFEAQSENQALKAVVEDIRLQVETGASLREAFEKYGSIFSNFFLGMIEAGETGGKLGETLGLAAVYLDNQLEMKKKLQSAFAYPITVCAMCLLIVSALVIFVIPIFQKLYKQLRVPLPGPTMILIGLSEAVRHYWWILVPAIVISIFGIRMLVKNKTVKAKIDVLKLNMPIIGKLTRMIVVSRFIRTFSMMCSAGVPLIRCLEIARDVADNSEMEEVSEALQERIMTGSSLSGPMSEYSIFPPMIVELAAAGEEAGILSEMLNRGVEFLDSYIDRAIKSLLLKIEPVLALVMGLIVGTILLGVYLPMFDYMGHVQ
jgi:type IV pilus assembly protein PilC